MKFLFNQLKGFKLMNGGQKLGRVVDVLFDWRSGRVIALVVRRNLWRRDHRLVEVRHLTGSNLWRRSIDCDLTVDSMLDQPTFHKDLSPSDLYKEFLRARVTAKSALNYPVFWPPSEQGALDARQDEEDLRAILEHRLRYMTVEEDLETSCEELVDFAFAISSEPAGRVDDIYLDLRQEQILFFIVSSGGLVSQERYACPFFVMHAVDRDQHLVESLLPEKAFVGLPAFQLGSFSDEEQRRVWEHFRNYYFDHIRQMEMVV